MHKIKFKSLTIYRRSKLVTYRRKHHLHIVLHHKLSLELLFRRDIGEHKYDLPLGAPIVRLYSNIIVHSIHIGRLLAHFRLFISRLSAFELLLVVIYGFHHHVFVYHGLGGL